MSHCDHLTKEDQAAALISAVQEGHADCVEAVIKSFINVKDGNEDPVLLTAARQGNLKCIEALVGAGADVNLSGKRGITPLTSSAARGYIDCVKFFIENGACVNSLNPDEEEFPLVLAAVNGQTEIIKILLDAGADVNRKRFSGFSALTRASGAGHHETLKILLERGAATATDEALEWAADGGHDKCLKLLLQAKYEKQECSAPLHKAIMKGYVDCADILIKAGADVNSRHYGSPFRNSGNSTALFEAVKSDHVQCVKKLMEAGADVNEDEQRFYLPSVFPNLLYNAAQNGSVECVGYLLDANPNTRTIASALVQLCEEGNDNALDILIQAGFDVNVESEDKDLTPIEAAAKHGHAKCVHLLLEAGADVTAALSTVAREGHEECLDFILDKIDNTRDLGIALTVAAASGRLNCMKKLLDAGADVDVPGGNEQTALIQAAERGQDKAVKFLLKEGAKVNSKDVHQKTALIYAASEGFFKCVELLIQAGADPNEVPKYGPTTIVAASQHLDRKTDESVDHGKCVKLLIGAGADVNTKDRDGRTALIFAVDFARDDVLKFLITAGADIHAANEQGNTPLFKAVEKFRTECTRLLISAGADVNATNEEGTTPLNIHYYGKNKNIVIYDHLEAKEHKECINLLLNTPNIDVNAVDKHGVTPLISAARNGHVDCLTSILRAGADVNKTDYAGNSALFLASWDVKCCDVLIGAGADINLCNNDGRSPLMFAVACHEPERPQKLLDAGADLHATMKNGNTAVFSVVESNSVRTAKWAYLRGISTNIRNKDGQNLVDYHLTKQSFSEQSLMVVIAAGEFVDPNKRDVIVQKTRNSHFIPEALPTEEELRSSLKQNCRETIRRHLLNINPHENLFVRIPKLQLPPPLERYLLYGLTASTLWY